MFSTEGHLFPMTPEISLFAEHCTYLGSYCNQQSDTEEMCSGENFTSECHPQVSNRSIYSMWLLKEGSDVPGGALASLKVRSYVCLFIVDMDHCNDIPGVIGAIATFLENIWDINDMIIVPIICFDVLFSLIIHSGATILDD